MKVCFIGLGSIGRRHIRNLKTLCEGNSIALTIDALRRKNSKDCEELKYVSSVYTELEKLPHDYDVIFLTNPTQFHADYLLKLQNNARHFFIEKPVATPDTVELLEQLEIPNDSVYYVAGPLRFHPVIQYIKSNIVPSDVRAVRCICSSYLPDWRASSDYRESYSAKKELGGGVSTDLIHEWDYLSDIFGMPEEIKYFIGKISNLEISSDDIAVYIARYQKMIVELHLDYFGRKTIRNLEIFTDNDTIFCDLLGGRVEYLVSGEHHEFSSQRDDFQVAELDYFLKLIASKDKSLKDRYGIRNAIKILKLTQGTIMEQK